MTQIANILTGTASRTQILRWGLALLIVAAAITATTQAQTYTILHNFAGGSTDGQNPYGVLIRDSYGNLYGTTEYGGFSSAGTVFKLSATGNATVLYDFTGGADGNHPYAGLVRDGSGNLYGTTEFGGNANYGVVFKVDTLRNEHVLYSFTGGLDGQYPVAGLIRDSYGNLYGTTEYGGAYGRGVVFKLSPTGKETVLHSFSGGKDGQSPYATLIRDSSGNLYGTTQYGGTYGEGTVFKVASNGQETVLHSFTGRDGAEPTDSVIRDGSGNLYGTTRFGGAGLGTVFKIDTANIAHVLHSFIGGADGAYPTGGLVRDTAGNLYGTTAEGGPHGWGIVFKLSPLNNETVLHYFVGSPTDGMTPYAGLLRDGSGNLYGTTTYGSGDGYSDYGVVFKLVP